MTTLCETLLKADRKNKVFATDPTPGSVKCTVNRDDSGSRLQMAFSRSGLSAAHMIPKPRIDVKIISSIYLRNQAIGRSVLSRARRARGSGI
jgi:hypothetical protein